ncbi:MAG: hypothetical protein AAB354_00410, partial [candidate division KSB1 bacterium]
MEALTLAAALAGILSFVYLLFLGQRSVVELWREKKNNKPAAAIEHASPVVIASTPPTIPHNLPHRADFVGREKEKRHVHEALRSRSYLVAIDGIGGIGKTSLAREVAQECLGASQKALAQDNSARNDTPLNPPSRGDFSLRHQLSGDSPKHPPIEGTPRINSPLEGGQGGVGGATLTHDTLQTFAAFIWTSAKDHELTLNDVLDTIAFTLDYSHLAQLPLEEKRHQVTKRLQEKSCLLVVDNFETITDQGLYDFLQALPEPSKCLVTSRTQSLKQARAISIRGL